MQMNTMQRKKKRDVFICSFYQRRPSSCLTNAVTVCKAEDALDLIKRDVLLDFHHVSVEFRGCTVEGKLKLTR